MSDLGERSLTGDADELKAAYAAGMKAAHALDLTGPIDMTAVNARESDRPDINLAKAVRDLSALLVEKQRADEETQVEVDNRG